MKESNDVLGDVFDIAMQQCEQSESRGQHDGSFERLEGGDGSQSFVP